MSRFIVAGILCLIFTSCNDDIQLIKEKIEAPTGEYSMYPFLRQTDERLLMTWTEAYSDSLVRLKYAEYDQNEWADPITVVTGKDWFVNWADFPSIVGNGKSRWTFVLKKSDPATFAYDIVLQRSENEGRSWEEFGAIHKDSTKTEHGFVSLVSLNDQNTLFAWLDGRNTSGGHDHEGHGTGAMQLRSAIIDEDGVLQAERIIDERTCDCCQTSMTLTDDGAVIVYRDRSDEEIRDIYYSWYGDQEWSAPKAVYNDQWKINGCPVNGPSIDFRDGLLATAWFSAANNQPSVKVAVWSEDENKFLDPIVLSAKGSIGRVDLEVLNDEQLAVSWIQQLNEEHVIQLALVSNGVVDHIETLERIDGSRASGFPQMEVIGSELIIAWTGTKENKNIEMRKLQLSNWLKKK